MYETFFGLREPPFSLTPNTRFFLGAETHRQALELLQVALRQGEGFLLISGEVGTGKTLLCRLLLNALEDEGVYTAWLPHPGLAPEALYAALADELAIEIDEQLPHRALRAIYDRLLELADNGRSVVLLIDEAQNLGVGGLEAVRLLTNLETEQRKLLKIVLFGQPELDQLLARNDLRQLRQRITFAQRLQPLTTTSVGQYLHHRLSQSGYNGEVLFAPGAVRLLARASGGVPRLINVLAHKSLWAAYGRGDRQIRRWHVRQAIRDTDSVSGSWSRWWRGWL